MKKILLLFVAACLIGTIGAQQPSFITDSLDRYINKGMEDWQVPGLAIVIVKDGKVVTQKGYGVRSLQTNAPVNAQTLFMIASNTKLFTGTSLALLENRGRLLLNDPVQKYLPQYRLYDLGASNMVTIRDLLTHRIGTTTFQGDFTFWNTNLKRSEIIERMRLLQPMQMFRQDFGYCNSCFLTAGEIIPAITGKSWEDFVHDSIIVPLGMNSTRMLSDSAASLPNMAQPYTTAYTGTLQRVPFDNWNNLAPAASIISNVSDLAQWLLFQLDSGRHEGRQVIPFSVLQKTRDVQIVTGSRRSSLYPVHFRGYGLGLYASDYAGRAIYWHTGGAGGMVSNVCFVPEEKLGIAILTNNDNQNFFELLRYQLLDAYLGVPHVNRSQQQLAGFKKELNTQLQQIAGWKSRVKGQSPALPLTAYTGTYTHPLYGNIQMSTKGKDLAIRFLIHPDLTATLSYMDEEQWLMVYNNIEYGIHQISFGIKDGKVQSVTTKQNEFVEYEPYTFVKQ